MLRHHRGRFRRAAQDHGIGPSDHDAIDGGCDGEAWRRAIAEQFGPQAGNIGQALQGCDFRLVARFAAEEEADGPKGGRLTDGGGIQDNDL